MTDSLPHHLREIITSAAPTVRNLSLDEFCAQASWPQLLAECRDLESFRHESGNLYEQVRACFFLYALYRFHLPQRLQNVRLHDSHDSSDQSSDPSLLNDSVRIPYEGYLLLLDRRFEEAISIFLGEHKDESPSDALFSALAVAYQRLAFQTLADQVRRSVRSVRGNQWMFRVGHPSDLALRVRAELLERAAPQAGFPILQERTPVRMDLTHSAWSDIFFLGMDFPEGARVLNVSIDLAVVASAAESPPDGVSLSNPLPKSLPKPPVEAYFRVIDEPVLRLVSVDLASSVTIKNLDEVFDFARDYLGLLKAALIASGLIPPGIEGSGQDLKSVLMQLVGDGRGIELISNVNGIPKGSRLAVSTNLLAALIAVCMRATAQTTHLIGSLEESERRLVATRAILGEWLAGSGGGWQDSGGVWPGIKLIEGQVATEENPEWGISRGRLLPTHHILQEDEAPLQTRQKMQGSLVLVHGGMAQNVGPILEMVTEKYLLRSSAEWQARQMTNQILDDILQNLKTGNIAGIGAATTQNFFGPLQTIVPWASNLYTEELIKRIRAEFAEDFWGFWMLGGMAGGGMGFMFDPRRKAEAQNSLQRIMSDLSSHLKNALPFAMEPVVYDFAINEQGSCAKLLFPQDAPLPVAYYTLILPGLVRLDPRQLTMSCRAELDAFASASRTRPEFNGIVQVLFDRLLPRMEVSEESSRNLQSLLEENGFDAVQHEQIREDLKAGRIGLAQNRLPVNSEISDVGAGDVFDGIRGLTPEMERVGLEALQRGECAVVTLAAGVGSRWTQGAGVVKALHPFAKLNGRHRTFAEVHLAKSRRIGQLCQMPVPHIFTTSYLTHSPIADYLTNENNYGYEGDLILSPGRSIGLRMVPMARDLRFAWEELPQQRLDEQAHKVKMSAQASLIEWARQQGEGSDYTDNLPEQCLHPIGHWYEIPNMLRNGTLAALLEKRPQLKYLLLHNIDTLGADVDPALCGRHILSEAGSTFEVIPRRLEDRGGGLGRVNGQIRLIEGLAVPREEQEFNLRYYNTLTTWITIDALLTLFGLTRADLRDEEKIRRSIRAVAARIPTYVTLKEVKRRWGQGQEDIFPVTQFEKLWGDMTALPELNCQFIKVPRLRGQQLKEQAQLDGWLRDGSAAYVESRCVWA